MNFEYETNRLRLKILRPSTESARQILDFYNKNRTVFERYEAMRPDDFYTISYHESILATEYNLALQQKCIRFWVYEKENPSRIIGTICFFHILRAAYDRCETGYKFDQSYWHKGYAKEAMQLGIFLMFSELDLHRIEAFVMEENRPSIRLLYNLDFKYEGLCHKSIKIHDRWEDHMLFACVR